MRYYGGIDPGLRNLGLAVLDETGKTQAAAHVKVQGLASIIGAVMKYIDPEVARVGIEAYSFFGPRKNYGPMCEVIGAIKATLLRRDIPYVMLQPRQKDGASRKLSRPLGESEHAFDARCLALLASEADTPGTQQRMLAVGRRPKQRVRKRSRPRQQA